MYLLLISLGMGLAYLLLLQVYQYFFKGVFYKYQIRNCWSLLIIVLSSFLINIIAVSVPDLELGNRLMHAFGGGFMVFMVCFFVVRDLKLSLHLFQYLLFGLLIVMSLGILNELLEFYLQIFRGRIFATTVQDTWFDLLSNLIGCLIGMVIFTPFHRSK